MPVHVRKWRTRDGEERTAYRIKFVYHHPDGTTTEINQTAQGDTQREAEREERNLYAALAAGTYRRHGGLTFEEAARKFLGVVKHEDLRPASLTFYEDQIERVLIPLLGKKTLAQINHDVIDKLRETWADKNAETRNGHLRTLRRVLRWCEGRGLISKIPRISTPKSKKPAREKYLTTEEVDLLLAHARHWHDFILFAARTGLRVGELMALRWENVDLERAQVRVTESIVRGVLQLPKNGKPRSVPLSPAVVEMLRKMPRTGELVFTEKKASRVDGSVVRDTGRQLTQNKVTAGLAEVAKRAGMRTVGPHAFRHHWASKCISRGVTLSVLMKWGGWSTVAVLERYAKAFPGTQSELVALLDG